VVFIPSLPRRVGGQEVAGEHAAGHHVAPLPAHGLPRRTGWSERARQERILAHRDVVGKKGLAQRVDQERGLPVQRPAAGGLHEIAAAGRTPPGPRTAPGTAARAQLARAQPGQRPLRSVASIASGSASSSGAREAEYQSSRWHSFAVARDRRPPRSEWREYRIAATKPSVLASTKCPPEAYTLAPSEFTTFELTSKAACSARCAIRIASSVSIGHG